MVEGSICADQVFANVRTGTSYIVLHAMKEGDQIVSTFMLHPETHKHIPCVVYRNPGMPGFIMVSSEQHFRNNFERI